MITVKILWGKLMLLARENVRILTLLLVAVVR